MRTCYKYEIKIECYVWLVVYWEKVLQLKPSSFQGIPSFQGIAQQTGASYSANPLEQL